MLFFYRWSFLVQVIFLFKMTLASEISTENNPAKMTFSNLLKNIILVNEKRIQAIKKHAHLENIDVSSGSKFIEHGGFSDSKSDEFENYDVMDYNDVKDTIDQMKRTRNEGSDAPDNYIFLVRKPRDTNSLGYNDEMDSENEIDQNDADDANDIKHSNDAVDKNALIDKRYIRDIINAALEKNYVTYPKDKSNTIDLNGIKITSDMIDSNGVKDVSGIMDTNAIKDPSDILYSNGIKDTNDMMDSNGKIASDTTYSNNIIITSDIIDSNGVKDRIDIMDTNDIKTISEIRNLNDIISTGDLTNSDDEIERRSWHDKCNQKAAKICAKACKKAHARSCKTYRCSKRSKRQFKKECTILCKVHFETNPGKGDE